MKKWFRLSRTAIAFASMTGGFLTMVIGIAYLWPASILFQPEQIWAGCLAVLYGIFIIAGNLYYVRKDRENKT